MADYYTLLTNAGIAYETACKAAGTPIKLTQISVGDGGEGGVYNPAATATALKREVWRGPLNALFQDEKNPSWLLAEVTIPPDVGGWYVREAGLWTDTGILYAIVKYPESFKPVLATSGSGKEFYIRSIFETSNASLVTLLIDDTVVKATRAWVMSYLAEELGKLDGKQSVRVAASSNIVLNGAQQIDGVAVIAGDRVLVANQTLAKDNGLWIVANGDWVRATDANSSAKVTPGLTVMVEEGIANGDSLWHLTTNAPITLGTTALMFKMLAGRTGIAAGTYKSLTVDEYGRATAGANPETLAGFGIKDSYTKGEVEALIAKASALPVGSIVAFPVDAPPPGFLELDNSVKSSATYPDLSAYLGGKFNKGDEGVGNFRLPEARGEFLRGWDHGRGVDASRVVGSTQKGTVTTFDSNPNPNLTVEVVQASVAAAQADVFVSTDYPGVARTYTTSGVVTSSILADGGVVRPRNIAVMWCIKAWNAPVNQGTIDVAALAKEVERLKSAVPVGAVLAFPTGIVVPGYLELDGSVQSIATYPDLAAYLGTVYNKGNEGAGNFRLPESRGEFLRGWDHGRGVDAGRGIGTNQAEAFAAHNHRYFDGTAATFDPAGNWQDGKINGAAASISTGAFLSPIENGSTMQMVNAANTVNAGGAETRPRNIAVMWCIKAWNAPINQGSIDIAALSEQLQQLSLNGPIAGDIRNARVSIPVAASTATFTASEMVLGDVNGKRVVISNFNQSINLSASVKGLGAMDVGAAPVNGFVAMYALYNPASRTTGIIAVNTTAAIAPKLLAGVAPDGYTFSALLSILPTNASAQFAVAEQVDRQVFYGTQVLSTTVPVLTLTGLSISAAVPLNAKSVSGNFQGTVSASGYSMALAGSAAAIGLQTFIVNFSGAGGGSFLDVPLLSPQTLFYRLSSAGTFNAFAITTNSYRF
ncbi:phage tail protein [Pseudomonas fluorescens]|uniref:phage tail-collar fiber domain-containing protein n=1 Tax=Pseudomonas fluorescens TaxID=294 RepID=UPI001CA64692|nr:phage tail protein [Pseudomonas fluorescens]MBY8935023.1 phage tail protein [Pseudomonas fluorescens]